MVDKWLRRSECKQPAQIRIPAEARRETAIK